MSWSLAVDRSKLNWTEKLAINRQNRNVNLWRSVRRSTELITSKLKLLRSTAKSTEMAKQRVDLSAVDQSVYRHAQTDSNATYSGWSVNRSICKQRALPFSSSQWSAGRSTYLHKHRVMQLSSVDWSIDRAQSQRLMHSFVHIQSTARSTGSA